MAEKVSQAAQIQRLLNTEQPISYSGRISRLQQGYIESEGPYCQLHELCRIVAEEKEYLAEVVAINHNRVQLLTYDDAPQLRRGDRVYALKKSLSLPISNQVLGRVVDTLLRPLDGAPPLTSIEQQPVLKRSSSPLDKQPVNEVLPLGIRCFDALLPLGKGQRIGIFSGSGVGKTTLSSTIACQSQANVVVLAMVGERSRELGDFIEYEFGGKLPTNCCIVFAAADAPALNRLRSAQSATTIAEYFRDQGNDVLLVIDSITRFAQAARELALISGELPAQRGYPPSVAQHLSRLVERAGRSKKGSISALYNVLVEGDDMDEPVADIMRGLLDGHWVLSRQLAQRQHYPAVDVLASVSRLLPRLCSQEQQKSIAKLSSYLAIHAEHADLLSVGAYSAGSLPLLDRALQLWPQILDFLQQDKAKAAPYEDSLQRLHDLGSL